MNKHTPGPWEVHADNRERDGLWELVGYNIESEYGEIVGCEGIDPWKDNAESNARLIAAAPDLIKAAEFALLNLMRNLHSEEVCGQPFMGDDEHEAIAILRAAIAKAKGEQ